MFFMKMGRVKKRHPNIKKGWKTHHPEPIWWNDRKNQEGKVVERYPCTLLEAAKAAVSGILSFFRELSLFCYFSGGHLT